MVEQVEAKTELQVIINTCTMVHLFQITVEVITQARASISHHLVITTTRQSIISTIMAVVARQSARLNKAVVLRSIRTWVLQRMLQLITSERMEAPRENRLH